MIDGGINMIFEYSVVTTIYNDTDELKELIFDIENQQLPPWKR